MALKEPYEIRKIFNKALNRLNTSKEPMSTQEQVSLANSLADVYNYVSSTVEKKTSTNAIYQISAAEEKQKQLIESEQKQLNEHKEFVESTFDKADQYIRTIQLGGYAAFFGIWGLTKDLLDSNITLIAVLIMTLSASFFILWEIFKSAVLSMCIRSHASIASSKIEKYIKNRYQRLRNKQSGILWLSKFRFMVWLATVLPAGVALSMPSIWIVESSNSLSNKSYNINSLRHISVTLDSDERRKSSDAPITQRLGTLQ